MTFSSGPGIGRDQARELARRELSRSIYHPSLLARWVHDIGRWLSSLINGGGAGHVGWWGTIALAVVLVAALAAVLTWLGPARADRRARDRPVLGDRSRRPADYRREAARLAAAGDYQAAITERVRAIAASLEVRAILPRRLARTADELAAEAARAFPGLASALNSAARLFDDVRYGGLPGSQAGYAEVETLDSQLEAAVPVAAGAATPAGRSL